VASGEGDVSVDEGERIRLIKEAFADPRVPLMRIGAMMTTRCQDAFEDQGREEEWPERITPNIPGILSDLERGVGVPARRFQPRPAVVDTGRLRNSITWRLVEGAAVEIGTNVPYAALQQWGGEVTIPITGPMKARLAQLIMDDPDRFSSLDHLLDRDEWNQRVARRVFITVTPVDREDIVQIVRDWFTKPRSFTVRG
jgi:phage gpG-like protein